MKSHIFLFGFIIGTAAILSGTQAAPANPIAVNYTNDPQCKKVGNGALEEEVGFPNFPADERIGFSPLTVKKGNCKGVLGGGDDFLISMFNTVEPAITLYDVFLVSDTHVTFANFDGFIANQQAKHLANEWKPGAQLLFTIMDSRTNTAFIANPLFGSLGISGRSFPEVSTYSIVANLVDNEDIFFFEVPEPSTLLLLLMGLGFVGLGYYATASHSRHFGILVALPAPHA